MPMDTVKRIVDMFESRFQVPIKVLICPKSIAMPQKLQSERDFTGT